VDGGVTGGLLSFLVLLVVGVEDNGCRVGASKGFCWVWWGGRGEVQLAPFGVLWVISGVGGVLIECVELVAGGVCDRGDLPSVNVGVVPRRGVFVVMGCLAVLAGAAYQENGKLG